MEIMAITDLSEDLRKFFLITADPRGSLKPKKFGESLKLVDSMSKEDKILLARADMTSSQRENAENIVIRGILDEALMSYGIRWNELEPLSLAHRSYQLDMLNSTLRRNDKLDEEERITSSTATKVLMYGVDTDKSVRSREAFELPKPVAGFYTKQKQHKERLAHATHVYFTDRVGLMPFLSSLHITYFDESKANVETGSTAISERSFRTTPEGWDRLFKGLMEIAEQKYGTSAACFREHFIKDFLEINVATRKPEIRAVHETHLLLDENKVQAKLQAEEDLKTHAAQLQEQVTARNAAAPKPKTR